MIWKKTPRMMKSRKRSPRKNPNQKRGGAPGQRRRGRSDLVLCYPVPATLTPGQLSMFDISPYWSIGTKTMGIVTGGALTL